MKIKSFLMLIVIALFVPPIFAQQQMTPCGTQIKYESKNQIDPSPLIVSVVSGRVISEVEDLGGSVREIGPVDKACIGLFTEKGDQLKATAVADDEGRFTFNAVPAGRYRLVVRANSLCVANVLIRIVRDKRGHTQNHKQIVIHMRAAGYDSCSYGDYY
jgi:hypothetical protein